MITHGETRFRRKTPEYAAWASMIQRCESPSQQNYKHYGGRGIKVCSRWRTSFSNFLADMGRKPTPKHTLERIFVNGNYNPENCRWATQREQVVNSRHCRMLNFDGLTLPVSLWAMKLKLPYSTLNARINKLHWPINKALSTPRL